MIPFTHPLIPSPERWCKTEQKIEWHSLVSLFIASSSFLFVDICPRHATRGSSLTPSQSVWFDERSPSLFRFKIINDRKDNRVFLNVVWRRTTTTGQTDGRGWNDVLYLEKTTEIDAKKAEERSLFFKGDHSVYQVRSNLEKSLLRKKLNKLKLLRERIDIIGRSRLLLPHHHDEERKCFSFNGQTLTAHSFGCFHICRRKTEITEKNATFF